MTDDDAAADGAADGAADDAADDAAAFENLDRFDLEDAFRDAFSAGDHARALAVATRLHTRIGQENPDEAADPTWINLLAFLRQKAAEDAPAAERAMVSAEAEVMLGEALTAVGGAGGEAGLTLANNRAVSRFLSGDADGGEALLRATLDAHLDAAPTGLVATLVNNLAVVLTFAGRFAEAVPLHEQAEAFWRDALGSQHPRLAAHQVSRAVASWGAGSPDEALRHAEDAREAYEQMFGDVHPLVARSFRDLAALRVQMGQKAAAGQDLAEARRREGAGSLVWAQGGIDALVRGIFVLETGLAPAPLDADPRAAVRQLEAQPPPHLRLVLDVAEEEEMAMASDGGGHPDHGLAMPEPVFEVSLGESLGGDLLGGEMEEMAPMDGGPVALTRFPFIEATRRTPLAERFSLFVQLRIKAPTPDAVSFDVLDFTPQGDPPTVEIVLRAHAFDISGSNTREVAVSRTADTEVRFRLTPHTPGPQHIRADFYQGDVHLGMVEHVVFVFAPGTPEVAIETLPEPRPGSVELVAGPVEVAAYLELRVTLDQTAPYTLAFYLNDPETGEFKHLPIGKTTLRGEPDHKFDHIYNQLTSAARAFGSRPEADELADDPPDFVAIGRQLWEDLIPRELADIYWKSLAQRERALLITSDEPWIPWELLKPFRFDEQTNEREEAPFWCEQFVLSRWLAEGPGPPGHLAGRKVQPVSSGTPDLPAAKHEMGLFGRLGTLQPSLPIARRSDLLHFLEANEDFSILHVACHGDFDPGLPDFSPLAFPDGHLDPTDLQIRFGAPRTRPLVFINACHAGRVGDGLTRLGGWAAEFVHARAGAFAGALWEVNDGLALTFAEAFYAALLGNGAAGPRAIGEAFRAARRAVREASPGNSTWLAYVLYANPGLAVAPEARGGG